MRVSFYLCCFLLDFHTQLVGRSSSIIYRLASIRSGRICRFARSVSRARNIIGGRISRDLSGVLGLF